MPTPKPYTPEQVAEIYGCSANHIRNLIKRGELRAFRLGPKLLRIPADALEEYEQRQAIQAAAPPRKDVSLHCDAERPEGITLRVQEGRR